MPHLTPPTNDTIYLSNLTLTTTIAPGDVWSRAGKPTPVILSLRLLLPSQDLARPGHSDNVEHTISYGTLAKEVTKAIAARGSFASLREFAEHVSLASLVLAGRKDVAVETRSVLPEGLLLAEGVGVEMRLVGDPKMMSELANAVLFVDRLRVACVVGVNSHERLQKQWVVINLRLWQFPEEMWTTYPAAMKVVVDTVEQSEFLTIETLATEIARVMCVQFAVERITVAVEKPSALTFAKGSGVEVTRSRRFFVQE